MPSKHSLHRPSCSTEESCSNAVISNEQCLDLSMNNYWIILYLPFKNPEFRIIHANKLENSRREELTKGSEVSFIENSCQIYAYVVYTSDDKNDLYENLKRYTQEFREEFAANILNIMSGRGHNIRDVTIPAPSVEYPQKHIIKVTDKETQTDLEDPTPICDIDIYQKYQELQAENKRLTELLAASVNEVPILHQMALIVLSSSNSSVTSGIEGVVMINNGRKTSQNLRGTLHRLESPELHAEEQRKNQTIKGEVLTNCDNIENVIAENGKICLGSGGTHLSASIYNKIKWDSHTNATRRLLMALFPRDILATHSLTGKPSPAFIGSNKEIKEKLDETVISDIIDIVSTKCGVTESMVRSAITTKCADENKMFKKRKKQAKDEAVVDDIKRRRI